MGYYSKNTDRMDIHIEETRGTILIKQKWKYSWLTMAGATAWTYPEKKLFHSKVDNLIWNSWGNHFFLKVEGNSDFSKRNSDKKWDVNFDIEWVLSSEHWDVNVTKLPSNHVGYEVSSVRWDSKIITIDTKDTAYRKIQGPRKKYYQYPLVHEFGHAAGNTSIKTFYQIGQTTCRDEGLRSIRFSWQPGFGRCCLPRALLLLGLQL